MVISFISFQALVQRLIHFYVHNFLVRGRECQRWPRGRGILKMRRCFIIKASVNYKDKKSCVQGI